MDEWTDGMEGGEKITWQINTTAGTREESRLKGSCISESASRELTVMSQRALLTTIFHVRHCNPQARWLALAPKAGSFESPYDQLTNRGGGTLKTFCLMFLTGGRKQKTKYACVDYS